MYIQRVYTMSDIPQMEINKKYVNMMEIVLVLIVGIYFFIELGRILIINAQPMIIRLLVMILITLVVILILATRMYYEERRQNKWNKNKH